MSDFAQNDEQLLDLWAQSHVDQTNQTAEAVHEDERPKRGMHGFTLRAIEARNRRRARAAKGTQAEVNAELATAKKGGVTADERSDITSRKELEAKLEMQYGLELTSSGTSRWGLNELQQIQMAMADIPAEHMRMVESINRAGSGGGANAAYQPGTHKMQVYDASVYSHTNTGIADRISGHSGGPRRGARNAPMTYLADTFQHEVGHAVMMGHKDAYQHFIDAAGWREVSAKDLDKLPAADRETLLRARHAQDEKNKGGGNGHDHDHDHETDRRATVVQGDQRISVDKYSDAFQARDEVALPSNGAGRWDYAGSSPEEHFAEVYAMALQVPETLHEEMISGPARDLENARDALATLHRAAHGAREVGDPAVAGPSQKQLADAQAEVARAEKAVASRKNQWNVMRKEIFGMDDKQVETQAKILEAQGASKEDLKQFREDGGKAMTPKQLERLAGQVKTKR
jgi:hypothetical protein